MNILEPREALELCYRMGIKGTWLRDIWVSDDLGTMREALRLLPQMTDYYRNKFYTATKQMSG